MITWAQIILVQVIASNGHLGEDHFGAGYCQRWSLGRRSFWGRLFSSDLSHPSSIAVDLGGGVYNVHPPKLE